MFFKTLVSELKRRARNRVKFWKNELRYKTQGDNRDAYTKKVHKCRYLELPDVIYNWGDKEQC